MIKFSLLSLYHRDAELVVHVLLAPDTVSHVNVGTVPSYSVSRHGHEAKCHLDHYHSLVLWGSCTPRATEPILQIFALDLCGVATHHHKGAPLAISFAAFLASPSDSALRRVELEFHTVATNF
jgi:hypothetical protein